MFVICVNGLEHDEEHVRELFSAELMKETRPHELRVPVTIARWTGYEWSDGRRTPLKLLQIRCRGEYVADELTGVAEKTTVTPSQHKDVDVETTRPRDANPRGL